MSNARQLVEMEAIDLAPGESLAGLLCPFCNGGRSRERTFSVSRVADGILHNCFRASCSEGRGFVPTGAVLRNPSRPPAIKLDRPYTGEYRPLESQDTDYFRNRFDLDLPPVGPVGVNEYGQYVLQVLNPLGLARGYVVRRRGWSGMDSPRPLNVSDGPKTRLFMNNSQQVPLSWYKPADLRDRWANDVAVLVEDQLSAMKVQQAGFTGIALLGTHLEANRVREIGMFRPKLVVIALDQDATPVALGMARTWGLSFNKTRVALLEHDLKDIARDDIREVLGI
jgi:hypothetical protein